MRAFKIIFFITKTLLYLEPPFGTLQVFTVKLQPVLYGPADGRVCVVHELEARHIGTSLLEFCEIKIQKSLKANTPKSLFTHTSFNPALMHKPTFNIASFRTLCTLMQMHSLAKAKAIIFNIRIVLGNAFRVIKGD